MGQVATIDKKADAGEKSVEFLPFGASEKIRLTASMVRQFIAVPTKSGALPTERDCIRFIMLCLGKRANPFEGDCFLIGYDSQQGPSFSMVCGIELFMKRAESSPEYDGCESGIIVIGPGGVEERQGALLLPDEQLVGGWARAYRKDRSRPEYKTVNFATYDTGKSRWQKDPPGMIEKVAKSQVLRAAYPIALGGLYTQEEMERVTQIGEGMLSAQSPPISMPKVVDSAQLPANGSSEAQRHSGGEPGVEVGVIEDVKTKTGQGKKGAWKRYGVLIDGVDYGTFETSIGEYAEKMKGRRVQFAWEQDGQYKALVELVAAPEEEPEPETGGKHQGSLI